MSMPVEEIPAVEPPQPLPNDRAPGLEPEVRFDKPLRWLNRGWDQVDALIHRFFPSAINPFGQLGAIANLCLIIAVISGVVLLYWYTPSVHQAHASLETIRNSSFLGQLTRSIHRYSSDAALFFILLHACRIVSQRRITGPRWLAWTTGLLLLALVSFIGWTGYWLVWDVRAQHAALGTARFLDSLPIFAEPLSRSFLTDETVPSVLFFVIFFIHMLAPLAMGIGIWMHLMRVNRARFIPVRSVTIAVIVSLVVLSALAPALSEAPAKMTKTVPAFTIDWWYLWPFALTDRLGGGALWGIFTLLGALLLSVPWSLAKRQKEASKFKAQVELARCMGCTLCAKDCPFNAITMIPRADGRKVAVQSHVNPALCVGCGICTGACDSQAINLPILNSREVERTLREWIRSRQTNEQPAYIAFACNEAAGASLRAPNSGYYVQTVPCAGWVSAVMIEHLLHAGADGVLVVGCSQSDPKYREGAKWFGLRLAGQREPGFSADPTNLARVRFVTLGQSQQSELARVAADFRRVKAAPPQPSKKRVAQLAAAASLAIVLSAVVFLGSDLPYASGQSVQPELVVSFNHKGALVEPRKLTAEELAKRLPHMRAQTSVTRQRSPIRVRVAIDGQTLFDQSFTAKGISKDGPSIGTFRSRVTPGAHRISVDIADGARGEDWTHQWAETAEFKNSELRVVLFNTNTGFILR